MASLLLHALKGAHAEVLEERTLRDRMRRAARLARVMGAELGTAAGLARFGLRSVRVKASLPLAGPDAAPSRYGVVLHAAVPYGPAPRHLIDVYVPEPLHRRLLAAQEALPPGAPPAELPEAPVIFFCHGGIWATGERWHFGPMATRLAQEGAVVAVASYTLYPEALAGEMAGEVLAALVWVSSHAARYGGCPHRLTVVGHSAGGHLGALALMVLAQQRQLAAEEEEAAADAAAAAQQQQKQKQRLQPELEGQQQQQEQSSQPHSQQQQQQQQQQPPEEQRPAPPPRRRRRLPLWFLPPDVADAQGSLPQPAAFVGMSAIYDVALHFSFEASRGVAGVSTMARACGGAALFDAVSPAVLLRRAADAAAGAEQPAPQPLQPPPRRQQGGHMPQHALWPELPAGTAAAAGYIVSAAAPRPPPAGRFEVAPPAGGAEQHQPEELLGEIIPLRSGLEPGGEGRRAGSAAVPGAPGAAAQPPPTADGAGAAPFFGDAAAELAGFCAAAAARLPPFVLMSSCSDHMVPWHEAADMQRALRACGVPAKHLIFQEPQHNDFVLDWSPLAGQGPGARAEQAGGQQQRRQQAGGGGGGAPQQAGASAASEQAGPELPAFARDLIAIVTGRVRVRFGGGEPSAAAPQPRSRL